MDYLSKYSTLFTGLSYEAHDFEYIIDNKFFESFENSVIKQGNVKVSLRLTRQENMLLLQFSLTGNLDLECDRCLQHFNFPVDSNYDLVIKQSDEPNEDAGDNIITISTHEHSINIAPHIYDYLSLLIPYRKVHPDDENGNPECDPEFLNRIENLTHHHENHNDPRWEALKKLKK